LVKGAKIVMQPASRKRRWPIVLVVIVAVCAAAYFLVPKFIQIPGLSGASQEATTGFVSAETARGDVVTSITATGSIGDNSVDADMPYGVNVSKVLVSSGDEVRSGDAIAKVDSSSLSSAVSDAKSALSDVNDELDAIADKDTSYYYISSKLKGTVKEVFAAKGDDAAKVVAEHGALMTVKLTDGGTFKVMNDNGIVDTIYKKKGDTVYSGTSLIRLTVPDAATSKDSLKEQRAKLLDLIEKLTALQTTKYIYAPATGKIGDINVSKGAALEKPGAASGDDGSSDNGSATEPDTDNVGAAFTIVLPDKFEMTVSVDELDISAVAEGQEASVAFDALEGQSFSGVVTEVSDSADTSSGVASYSATLVLDKSEGMLSGMSATATIIKEKKENVITIPLDAVQQYGEDLFVYTSIAEDGALGGEVKIETGLSDGAVTEVTSGLDEGTVIYYVPTTDDSNGTFQMRDGGFMMGGGGPVTVRSGGGESNGGFRAAPAGGSGGAAPSGGSGGG
jgi:multidrug efflux pump subunit AcrA (membrane-fusion protein)